MRLCWGSLVKIGGFPACLGVDITLISMEMTARAVMIGSQSLVVHGLEWKVEFTIGDAEVCR